MVDPHERLLHDLLAGSPLVEQQAREANQAPVVLSVELAEHEVPVRARRVGAPLPCRGHVCHHHRFRRPADGRGCQRFAGRRSATRSWAVTGSSVIGSVLTTIHSMSYGFSTVQYLGLVIYASPRLRSPASPR